ncbi:hypothetical protein L3X38_026042 [Prunus dulcis]|uniref:Uncharacterized protein n=1 Tax=Prunus dulcis TaxID=3755 RepID=A0AAD4W3Z9_PRUDU|nr:hypothetical protein L3X38_026042 [Prunus dulcis]
MSSVAVGTALHLPAAQPPALSFQSTSDTTVDTSPQLPAMLPLTPPFLTSDTTVGTSPQLPASLRLDTCLLSSCRLSFLGLVIDYLGAWFCFLGDHRLHGFLACVVLSCFDCSLVF